MANTTGKKFGGRQKGTPNKVTQKAREDFQQIMAGNVDRVEKALEEIYKKDKKTFLYVLSKYFPYFLPRQEQIDISNPDGSLRSNNKFTITFRDESEPDQATTV